MDALVTCQEENKTLTLYAVIVTNNKTRDETNVSLVSSDFNDQVLLLDWNGDYFVDILGTRDGKTVILLNDGNATFTEATNLPDLPSLSVPNSNAFVDVDGDCHADLILTEKGQDSIMMSIWLYRNDTYKKHASIALPQGVGQISFADFNRDGSIDMLFPVCWPAADCSEVNSIVLVNNVQLPLCGGVISSKTCRSMTEMCVADEDFFFADFSEMVTKTNVTVVQLKDFDKAGVRFVSNDQKTTRPLSVSVGDYNLDGYPDLLVTVVNVSNDRVPFVQLWESVVCNSTTCPELNITDDNAYDITQRTFVLQTEGTSELTNIEGVYAAAFLDFGESGALSVIALSDPQLTHSGTGMKQIHGLYNNFRLDALFIKALGLNGVCTDLCPTGEQFPDPKPYGVNFPGGSFKFALTDTDGTNLGATGAQMYRTAYQSLQTPYVMFGLGRISNYIQTVFYGTPAANPNKSHFYWQGIIPNSYIFAIPYPPDTPSSWTIDLFLAPSSVVLFVIIVVIVSLISLGGLIIYFKMREIKEDRKKKEEERHAFDFNSL